MSLSGRDLFHDVVTYAAMGEHRTGTPADIAATDWIAERLDAAGCEVGFSDWKLRRFLIDRCELEVEARSRECLPLWFPRPTGPVPIQGPLTCIRIGQENPAKVNGRIALVKFEDFVVNTESSHERIISDLADHGALAVIGYNPSFSGEVLANNVHQPYNQQPWPVPVVQVGARDRLPLIDAAGREARASLIIDGRDENDVPVRNVMGRLDRGGPWVVVSTPQSGWFRCAGERGSGLAMFLGLAQWAGSLDSEVSWLFLSNTGHELGNMGMHHTLKHAWAPPPDQTLCWLHLGASVAVYNWKHDGRKLDRNGFSTATNLVGVPELMPDLTEAFAGLPHLNPKTGPSAGELADALNLGYRAFGFFGGHYFFHTPSDGPETTGPELLEPVALALARALESIISRFA